MESFYLEYQQERIHYKKAGYGPSIILLHGLGETGESWNNQASYLLNNGFQLIIPDFPGSGQSTMHDAEAVSLDKMALIVRKIVVEEKILPPAIVGHSMGGYVALKYMELFPSSIGALGMIHSTAFPDTDEKKSVRTKSISFIETNGIEAYLSVSFSGLFSEENSSLAAIVLEQAKNISGATIIQYHRAIMERKEHTETLKNCSIPLLIIAGKHDKAVPLTDALAQSHLASTTHFHVLKNSAHMGHWEEKDEVNKILENFLRRD